MYLSVLLSKKYPGTISPKVTGSVMTEQKNNNPYRQTEQDQKPGLLDGLSISQVIAGALAAVTSVLLSSQIGIAGSIIGVAVASVVSTVASQLYRGMLLRSADKFREMRSTGEGEEQASEKMSQANVDSSDATVLLGAHVTEETGEQQALPARIAPATLRARAAQRRQDTLRRRIIIAAVVSSLAAVAVVALIITLVTGGSGLGTKVSLINSRPAAVTTVPAATAPEPSHSEPVAESTEAPTTAEAATAVAATTETSTTEDASTSEATTSDATDTVQTTEAPSTDASAQETESTE